MTLAEKRAISAERDERIIALREIGLTRNQIAEHLGIPKSTVVHALLDRDPIPCETKQIHTSGWFAMWAQEWDETCEKFRRYQHDEGTQPENP